MKITLYCRRHPKRPSFAYMRATIDEEPCYDSPNVINLANDIKAEIDRIIAKCEKDGYILSYTKIKTRNPEK